MGKTFRIGFVKKDENDYHSDRIVKRVPESISNKGCNKLFSIKLTPYVKKYSGMYAWGRNKFSIKDVYSSDIGTKVRGRTGFGARQHINNLNRGIKKTMRQHLKKELRKELMYNP